ncbi:PREDICTED: uncharacterized protein LOC108364293 [Rhagoletis zephyria]|uniref:uncharacterized protein LOC108364293 n=1 Tax=Rhagoletis zephyria TaxID=28612 RepID=UPI0008117A16|nr:PREDICTED: uncharacterized protein LOC108364293 [Rhagoletis zephyria]
MLLHRRGGSFMPFGQPASQPASQLCSHAPAFSHCSLTFWRFLHRNFHMNMRVNFPTITLGSNSKAYTTQRTSEDRRNENIYWKFIKTSEAKQQRPTTSECNQQL